MPYLTGVNNEFRDAVSRTFGYKSGPMKAAILAVSNFQRLPNRMQLTFLERAMQEWQRTNPNEYRNRMNGIQVAFDAELVVQRLLYPAPAAILGNMAWVQAVAAGLDAFKEYAVGDILAFMDNSAPDKRQDCLARYVDYAHAEPEPERNGPRVAGVMFGTAWNANRARMMHRYVTYRTPRQVRYTPEADISRQPRTGAGRVTLTSRGSAVCTEFAFAAAHVLTDNRDDGPRVEVVSWSGGGQMAHCFVIVGRQVPPGPAVPIPMPTVDLWGPDCVIVDTWLAALGHKAAYRLSAGDIPFPGFLRPLTVVMARPAA
jgi:hypothetical protein